MNPRALQSSTKNPFICGPLTCSGSPLPRSFKPPSHGIRAYKAFLGLSIAHLPLTTLSVENELRGLSRAFFGAPFTFLQNLSWAYRLFRAIPAPYGVVVFGAFRRVCAGANDISVWVRHDQVLSGARLVGGIGSQGMAYCVSDNYNLAFPYQFIARGYKPCTSQPMIQGYLGLMSWRS